MDLLAAIALFAGLGFAAFDDMITVTIGASHGNEYHGPSPYQWWPQHGIMPGESTDLKHYRGRIFCPNLDATMATRQYAKMFLAPVDPRYPKIWELLWRTFRNGMAHASWPNKAFIEGDPSRQLILAVGNLRSDPHLAPLPGKPGSLAISAPRLLDDLAASVKNGFSHLILTEADDGVLMRAGPQLMEISRGDPAVCQQFHDAFEGRLA